MSLLKDDRTFFNRRAVAETAAPAHAIQTSRRTEHFRTPTLSLALCICASIEFATVCASLLFLTSALSLPDQQSSLPELDVATSIALSLLFVLISAALGNYKLLLARKLPTFIRGAIVSLGLAFILLASLFYLSGSTFIASRELLSLAAF